MFVAAPIGNLEDVTDVGDSDLSLGAFVYKPVLIAGGGRSRSRKCFSMQKGPGGMPNRKRFGENARNSRR